MGTVEATLYNRVRGDLIARGITNFTDPYYGAEDNSARTDDRQAEKIESHYLLFVKESAVLWNLYTISLSLLKAM